MNLFSMSPRKGCLRLKYRHDKFSLRLVRAFSPITTPPDVSEDCFIFASTISWASLVAASKGVSVCILALRDTVVSKSIVQ